MSRILRRPMFRGGKVDSRGTGITSGLGYENGGRVGYDNGGQILQRARSRIRGPRDLGITNVNPFFQSRMNIGTRRKPKFVDTPLYEEFPEVSQFPLTADAENIMTDATVVDTGTGGIEDLKTTADVEAGLPTSKVEDLTTETEVEKVDIKDDEPEVTMTDLEKALGLDRARQEYAADALAAASKAFFEGKGFGAIADAAAVKSKAPDIKRIAALEEFKMKGAKDIAQLRKQQKEFAPGNFEKNDKYLQKKYPKMDERERLKILQKKPSTFAEQYIELSKDFGYKNADIFKDAAFLYFGNDYISDVATDGDMTIGEPTPTLSDGIYTDAANELIFVVKDKKVTSRKKF